jgi:hypothetical protein
MGWTPRVMRGATAMGYRTTTGMLLSSRAFSSSTPRLRSKLELPHVARHVD